MSYGIIGARVTTDRGPGQVVGWLSDYIVVELDDGKWASFIADSLRRDPDQPEPTSAQSLLPLPTDGLSPGG